MSDARSQQIVDGLGDAALGEVDRQASRAVVDVLRAHRATASGAAAVPAVDPALSSKVMAEARTRSQEIRLAGRAPARADRPIPWWLWLAWIAALAAFVVLWVLVK